MVHDNVNELNVMAVSYVFQGKCKYHVEHQILSVICLILSQAVGRHESLTGQNMEKKARWREEVQKEREAALALSEKAQ